MHLVGRPIGTGHDALLLVLESILFRTAWESRRAWNPPVELEDDSIPYDLSRGAERGIPRCRNIGILVIICVQP